MGVASFMVGAIQKSISVINLAGSRKQVILALPSSDGTMIKKGLAYSERKPSLHTLGVELDAQDQER
jgi:hypothetical protein